MRASSDKPEIPKNVIDQVYSASYQPENGKIYDRKPFKMRLYPKKNYMWCLCGYSKSQVKNSQAISDWFTSSVSYIP